MPKPCEFCGGKLGLLGWLDALALFRCAQCGFKASQLYATPVV